MPDNWDGLVEFFEQVADDRMAAHQRRVSTQQRQVSSVPPNTSTASEPLEPENPTTAPGERTQGELLDES